MIRRDSSDDANATLAICVAAAGGQHGLYEYIFANGTLQSTIRRSDEQNGLIFVPILYQFLLRTFYS